jgi:hypothetical protein
MVTPNALRTAQSGDILPTASLLNRAHSMYNDHHRDPSQQTLINLLMGFFGVLGAFLFLPRVLRFFGKRFAFGIVSEIVTIAITGLLTEKLVSHLGKNGDDAESRSTTDRF